MTKTDERLITWLNFERTYVADTHANVVRAPGSPLVEFYVEEGANRIGLRTRCTDTEPIERLRLSRIEVKKIMKAGETRLDLSTKSQPLFRQFFELLRDIADRLQAEKLLKDGKTFTEVAKTFSDIKRETGGKLPLWPAGSLRQKKVEQAAFTLKQGERSGILETAPVKKDGLIVNFGGLYIVKAYEIQEGRVTSFEDAQEEIGKILREKQLDILSAKFSERLSKEARIPQSSEFIDTAVDEAINIYWPVDKP